MQAHEMCPAWQPHALGRSRCSSSSSSSSWGHLLHLRMAQRRPRSGRRRCLLGVVLRSRLLVVAACCFPLLLRNHPCRALCHLSGTGSRLVSQACRGHQGTCSAGEVAGEVVVVVAAEVAAAAAVVVVAEAAAEAVAVAVAQRCHALMAAGVAVI